MRGNRPDCPPTDLHGQLQLARRHLACAGQLLDHQFVHTGLQLSSRKQQRGSAEADKAGHQDRSDRVARAPQVKEPVLWAVLQTCSHVVLQA
jgi:hypothetical protein